MRIIFIGAIEHEVDSPVIPKEQQMIVIDGNNFYVADYPECTFEGSQLRYITILLKREPMKRTF